MITAEHLRGACSEAEALAIFREAKSGGSLADFCRAYMHDADYQVARNALWALTKANAEEHSALQPLLDELIDLAMSAGNSSVRRLALCNIERLRMGKEYIRAEFLDFCLERMMSLGEYPGTQTLCMKLAFRMSRFYPELMQELLRTIEAMEISYCKPAVKSLRARILAGKFERKVSKRQQV